MALTSKNQLLIAYKKLVGKAHTSAQAGDVGEAFASNVQMGTGEIFAEDPSSINRVFNTEGVITSEDPEPRLTRLVTFDLVPLDSSVYPPNVSADQGELNTNGPHGFRLQFPNDDSDFANVFVDANASIQLVPQKYGNIYTAKVFSGTTPLYADGNQDWSVDYYAGLIFFQDLETSNVPSTLEAYIYTGKYVSDVLYSTEETLPGDTELSTLLKAQVERLEVIRDGEPVPTFDNLADKENAAKFSGSVGVSGDLEVNGTLHTKKLIVEETTQVITNTVSQANNIFGDPDTSADQEDTHTFYGDVNINGNLSVTGDGPNKKKVFEITRETALENPSSTGIIEIDMDSPPPGLSNMVKGNVFLINNLDTVSATNDKIEIRLPNIAVHDLWNGIEYTFKHLCGEGHQVKITGCEGEGQDIDGNPNIILHVQYETLTVVAYNGSWHIV